MFDLAPLYHDSVIATRLNANSGNPAAVILSNQTSVKGRLRGPISLTESFLLPPAMSAGPYSIEIALLNPLSLNLRLESPTKQPQLSTGFQSVTSESSHSQTPLVRLSER